MPLTAQKLNSVREEMEIPYAGEQLHIIYNPQGYTPELERRMAEALAAEIKSDGLIFMLKSMLVDWDLEEFVPKLDEEGNPVLDDHHNPVYDTEEDGTVKVRPFGTENEKLQILPVKFLSDVTLAIANEIKAASDGGNSSAATSPPTAT